MLLLLFTYLEYLLYLTNLVYVFRLVGTFYVWLTGFFDWQTAFGDSDDGNNDLWRSTLDLGDRVHYKDYLLYLDNVFDFGYIDYLDIFFCTLKTYCI